MTRKLKEVSTARLTFSIQSGITIDNDGNRVPKTTELKVLAYLKRDGRSEREQRTEGIDPLAVYLSGYATEPSDLSVYAIGIEAKCDMGRIVGVFRMSAFQNPPFGRASFDDGENIGTKVERKLGTRLEGWFIPNQKI